MTRQSESDSEAGFTLVELLIVTMLIPIVVGSISLAVMTALSIQSSVSNRVGGAGGDQVASTWFYQDVQGALMVTTSATAPQCGIGTQVMGLEWGAVGVSPVTYNDVVSYVDVSSGGSESLIRNFCNNGASATPTSTSTLTTLTPAADSSSTITPFSEGTAAAAGWTPTQGITDISMTMGNTQSATPYTLVATPAVSSSGGVA